MSVSYYYVVTYNLQHPTIKKFLHDFLECTDSAIVLQTRSKLYHDFNEVTEAANCDFDLKCTSMYTVEQAESQYLKCVTAINPAYSPEIEQSDVFITSDWQSNCAGAIFFLEAEEEDDDDAPMHHQSWMIKYELYFVEDAIETVTNGESIFTSPVDAGLTTSTYH